MEQFAGKVALITGSAGGIGRAAAIAFATRGADVVLADVNDAGNTVTAALVEQLGRTAVTAVCDVRSEHAVSAAVSLADMKFGRLDFAFNNAGRQHAAVAAADLPVDQWREVIDIDLTGVFLCMRAEIPLMLRGGSGSIVNTSSGAGLRGTARSAGYAAAKHAVIGLTKSAALDYAPHGIRVNAICPGITDTDMAHGAATNDPDGYAGLIRAEPIGRLGTPEEIANAVTWLCSDDASFVLGQAFAVDGGWST